jgi:hypothetical protein
MDLVPSVEVGSPITPVLHRQARPHKIRRVEERHRPVAHPDRVTGRRFYR